MGIAGIILGFILAVNFYLQFTGILEKVIKENSVLIKVLSFLLIIGIVYGASVWLARYIANINSGTGLIDKNSGNCNGFFAGIAGNKRIVV